MSPSAARRARPLAAAALLTGAALAAAACAGLRPAPSADARLPDTDVYLAAVTWGAEGVEVGAPRNLTRRSGYDNQPRFAADGTLYYTRIEEGRADIWMVEPLSGEHRALASTAQSEYSPTPLPDGSVAVVRVEEDGRQRLWRFPTGGGEAALVLPELEPVGYFAFLGGEVAAYVLGEPATLVLTRPGSEDAPREVARDIGRALLSLDDRRLAFVQKGAQEWWLAILELPSGEVTRLAPTLPGREDFTVDPFGGVWMAGDAALWRWHPAAPGWRPVAELAAAGVGAVTRLAFSADGALLAFVGEVAPAP
jgi:hypothetical protein